MEVYVVRDSNCGNGNDDPGKVLGCFATYDKAEIFLIKIHQTNRARNIDMNVEIEGPFELEY